MKRVVLFILLVSLVLFHTSVNAESDTVMRNTIDGVDTIAILPDNYNPGIKNKFVVFFHGAGAKASDLLPSPSSHNTVLQKLLKSGYVVIGSDYSSLQNWGNPDSVKETGSLVKFYKSRLNLQDQPFVYAGSMGGITALNAIAKGAIKPKGVAAVQPVVNLRSMYLTDFKPYIEQAFNFEGPQNLEKAIKGYDPLRANAESVFVKYPFKIWASYEDKTVNRILNTDLFVMKVKEARGKVDVITAEGDHGDPSHWDADAIVKFFEGINQQYMKKYTTQ